MPHIDLSRLRPGQTVAVNATIAPDAELWSGSELALAEAVEVDAAASLTDQGDVLVRGSWRATALQECGRCLEPARLGIERPLTLLYLAGGEAAAADDPDARVIGWHDTKVDLGEAIREEVLLEVPAHLLPPATEEGRCSRCGRRVRRLTRSSEKTGSGPDPRWAALTALLTDETPPD